MVSLGVLRYIWKNRNTLFTDITAYNSPPSEFFKFTGSLISVVVCSIILLSNISNITNVWYYTAVAKPELYLAKLTIDAVKTKIGETIKK